MNIVSEIGKKSGIAETHIQFTLSLLEDGATIPFIARYRKEKTGGLDEVQLRLIQDLYTSLQALESRRETVLKSIREQGKLTKALEKSIRAAVAIQDVEDLYLPYKQKRKTRAAAAMEMGLEPLALFIIENPESTAPLKDLVQPYLDPAKGVTDEKTALAGVTDIIAGMVGDSASVRKIVRTALQNRAMLCSKPAKRRVAAKGKKDVYQVYRDFRKPVRFLKEYQVLALNRGEREGFLSISFEFDHAALLTRIVRDFFPFRRSRFGRLLKEAVADGFERLIFPAVSREMRSSLTKKAEEHAIAVFAGNLRQLLLQPPVSGRVVMGIDPGFVSGCKLAVVDATGAYLEGAAVYPHPPQKKTASAKETIAGLIRRHNVEVIAIGNGTAGRETEAVIAELIGTEQLECRYLMVSEAGASVYSASKLAGEEFPELEASQRGNISIARRVVDPLAELVKIDPKAVGVGLYQHDVDQKALSAKLDAVVESCVNHIGIDLNTASVSLLQHVSGLNKKIAESIIARRSSRGAFRSRGELLAISGMGPVKYEQSAGFLRIRNGDEPLDNTAIHPESYEAAERLLAVSGLTLEKIRDNPGAIEAFVAGKGEAEIAERIGVGLPTLRDIVENLKKPGLDPRDELAPPLLRSDILKLKDLKPGMRLQGTVRNVVDFGVFIDIGVKHDGLMHVSGIKDLSGDIMDNYRVGDVVPVVVEEIDVEKERISLRPGDSD